MVERAKLIKNVLNLHKVEDFLTFYPIRYIDKSKLYKVGELREINNEIPLKGRITDIQEVAYAKGRRMVAKFRDETGTMELVWFKYSKWLKEQIPLNTEVVIFGRVQVFNNVFSMPHPEIEKMRIKKTLRRFYLSIQVVKN